MRDSMKRGGPDDAGEFVHDTIPLALGHRRLSILDLSKAGHQPMQTADARFKIVFNGEVYNFKRIRKELETFGYQFNTQTDTEVILYSYKHWGKACFEKFNGMFALAIWDEEEQEIVLARDHAGIKPLYYYLHEGLFVFASEIRAFQSLEYSWECETFWKSLVLIFGHLPEPFTTIKNVKSLPKGHWMSIQIPSLSSKLSCYYKDDYEVKIFDEETALELTRDILSAAVKRHLISDAPLGLFLSGGVDSSLLTLLAAPLLQEQLQTLSIQFEEAQFSEEQYQRIIIDITESTHNAFTVTQRSFDEALPDILMAMDQPSTDAINTYFISKYAKQCNLKAVLSGVGADELFGGYPSFKRFNKWSQLNYLPTFVSRQLAKIKKPMFSKLSYKELHPMLSLYLMNSGLYTVKEAASLTDTSENEILNALNEIDLPTNINYKSPNAVAAMEMHLYMKNQLLRDADYMSMWHGVEIRVPFLDKELVQTVSSISPEIKFKSAVSKSLLIESFATILPAEIWNRKKQGFTFPFEHWLKNSEQLMPSGTSEQHVYNDFINGKVHWSRYWSLKVAGLPKFS